jgi:methyl-accepting chemotaxis protein
LVIRCHQQEVRTIAGQTAQTAAGLRQTVRAVEELAPLAGELGQVVERYRL